jgi:hypothetical protein
MDEDDFAIFDRALRRYLDADESERRLADAIGAGMRHLSLIDEMRDLLESGDPKKIQGAAKWIAEQLRRSAQ